ncbi:MAG: hypothetical protein WD939_01045 [Dehalococcoidia bacterium]
MSRWQSVWETQDNEPDGEALEEEGDELDEGEWELDPNDPSHPDYDLSVAAGYGEWEPSRTSIFLRRGMVLLLSLLVIFGLIIPVLVRITG